MPKTKTNVRELYKQYQVNCDRINEIADTCEKEKRERNDAENAEFKNLERSNQLLHMRMVAASEDYLKENPNAKEDAEKIIRENAQNNRKTQISFVREIMVVDDVQNGGIIPLNVETIMKPLTEGFILDKVGLPMLTGLSGDYIWPMYEMVEATVLEEKASLTDSKIEVSKLSANPARMGIAIPVTNQTINQTHGLIETIIREVMPRSIKELLNKILFSTKAVNTAARTAGLVGPFVKALNTKVALANVPTFTQLNKNMKAAVLETGITGENLCWIMTKSMQAILEGTPINSKGIYVPMVQNGMLCGLPIYTTNAIRGVEKSYQKYNSDHWEAYPGFNPESDTVKYHVSGDTADHAIAKISGMSNTEIAEVTVNTEYIGLGDWRYQPMGLFGDIRFVVNPYSKAREDSVDFVLNVNYGTKTLREEAFMLGEVAATV